jgi:hypothetical protein
MAYSELTRVLPWSIRALGYKFGTADRAAHLVATAAAMDPVALEAVVRAGARPECTPTLRRAPGQLAIDAQGISLLEIGPVAVDYLAAHADEAEQGTCLITGATELSLLPAIVAGAGAYDLSCLAMVAAGNSMQWYLGCPDGECSVLVAGEDYESLVALVGDRRDVAELVNSLHNTAGTIIMRCGIGLPVRTPLSGTVRPVELVKRAQRKGIPVSQATLDGLYGLEMLTWAPTSERSRAQAGFTTPSGPRQ